MAKINIMQENMVDGQIHTSGVIDERILGAFKTVPRDIFVKENLKNAPCVDEVVGCRGGRFILSPQDHAKMLQALEVKNDDIALDIGCGAGYSSAILSKLCSTVIAIESNETCMEVAQSNWDSLNIGNIASLNTNMRDGYKKEAPYNAIFMNGAVEEVPVNIVTQLVDHGKMVCILKPVDNICGTATLVQHNGGGRFSSYPLFEATSPYLPGFEPKERFVF